MVEWSSECSFLNMVDSNPRWAVLPKVPGNGCELSEKYSVFSLLSGGPAFVEAIALELESC